MATPNSSSPQSHSSILSSFSHVVTTKLTDDNFLIWKVQITAYLRGQDLYCYVDGSLSCPSRYLDSGSDAPTKPNPDYHTWNKTDQLVLSILFSSLSNSVIGHVLSSTTSRQLWLNLTSMFTSHSQAKEFQVKFQLTNLSRGDQSITDYYGKVRSLADTLSSIGNPLPDKE
ncbi:hypothetical protein F2P56_035783, partial [Juglans regia]